MIIVCYFFAPIVHMWLRYPVRIVLSYCNKARFSVIIPTLIWSWLYTWFAGVKVIINLESKDLEEKYTRRENWSHKLWVQRLFEIHFADYSAPLKKKNEKDSYSCEGPSSWCLQLLHLPRVLATELFSLLMFPWPLLNRSLAWGLLERMECKLLTLEPTKQQDYLFGRTCFLFALEFPLLLQIYYIPPNNVSHWHINEIYYPCKLSSADCKSRALVVTRFFFFWVYEFWFI